MGLLGKYLSSIYKNKKSEQDKWYWTVSEFTFNSFCFVFGILNVVFLIVQADVSKFMYSSLIIGFWASMLFIFLRNDQLKKIVIFSNENNNFPSYVMKLIETFGLIFFISSVILWGKLG